MKNTAYLLAFMMLILSCSSCNEAARKGRIAHLMVEYTETPLGIDVEQPRFSWQMTNPTHERGARQTAYQLCVTDEHGKEVWQSGRILTDKALNIQYEGAPLEPVTRYHWTVDVWDQHDKKHAASSWFETGLMNPALDAWHGAKWIGGGDSDLVIFPHYLPVFKLNYTIRLDAASGTTKAGFIYGANDSRLMNKDMNIYNIRSEKDQSYVLLELDISGIVEKTSGGAFLHIYRAGFHPDDTKERPLRSVPIPASLLNRENMYADHSFFVHTVFGRTQIYLDGESARNLLTEERLNPVGDGGDYIAFPQVADIGYSVPAGRKAFFSAVEIRNYRSPSHVLFAEEPGIQEGGTDGLFSLKTPQRNAMPMLRTVFTAGKQGIDKARLYVTARGIYEVYLNGQRVGNDRFNPGLTQYPKTHLYQTYDVTKLLTPGDNAVGAWLAEGWWSGGATFSGQSWNFFGDRQSLLAQLIITYKDGTQDVITTHPETWKYYNDGPIVYGSFFQGEVYDATKEAAIEGWTLASYNDAAWKSATEVSLENHTPTGIPALDDYSNMALTGQQGPTVYNVRELTAVSVDEVRPGVFVYDMGQNMVGVPLISLTGQEPGRKINLRFAEVTYPDLPEYKDNVGMLMLENIRAAMAQDIYITRGGKETIHPRFTFHGYRFVEITGIDRPLPLRDVRGEVISSIEHLASHYETSNPKVNKLWENITWSTLGNFLSIPTDCPQRNERMGWSGDISVYSRTATYMANVAQFLRRHMQAMRDTQRADGRFADVAPLGGGFGGILWGSAGITVAWESYQQYDDEALLREHYAAMKHYIDHILTHMIDPASRLIVQERSWGNLADWLGPEDNRNDRSLLWEAYFLYDLELMRKIASVLNKAEDAAWFKELYDTRKAFFNKTYLHPETGKTLASAFVGDDAGRLVDTQTSYVLPLAFGLATEEHRARLSDNLVETIRRENTADNGVVCPPYSLMTGFIGTAWITKALSDHGASDVAYQLLQQTSYPSWLYSVEQGSTTIWERLNSYTHTHGFGGNNSMNSFNHYSFGAVGAWMYNHSLGIERDENHPGFKHFLLKPEPDPTGAMSYAKGYYDSMYGRITSHWEREGDHLHYRFTIPANTSASLMLEAPSADDITENGQPLRTVTGVTYKGEKHQRHLFELPAGTYHVSTPAPSVSFKR